jgi:glycosyltransferase involved in cell wall biosynthesis
MSKKILIAAANHWSSPYQVGSHHYARVFAKNGWQVLFVSDPISPFHFLPRNNLELKERYRIYSGIQKTGYENIITYVPMALITPNERPVFRSGFVARNWHKITIPDVTKFAVKNGFGEVDILWFDSLVQHFWIDAIKHKKSILRISDRMDAFKKITKNLKNFENDLLNRADLIIYSANSLKSYIEDFKEKAFHVPNGVETENFTNSDRSLPLDLENIPKPRAIYIGAIDEWFDQELLLSVANILKEISFILIGNPKANISTLKNQPNIYFLGRRNYTDIPKYLYNCNLGIIPFNKNHPVVNSVNPIKLYEYMVCGLPVVATRWKELELIDSPAYLADNPKEFAENILKAIKNKEKQNLIEFALSNTWEERFKKIIDLCDNYESKKA